MEKPQIAVTIHPNLLYKLNSYIEKTGKTKTNVMINAIAQYIGCVDSVPLTQQMAELEQKFTALEAKLG